MPRPSLPPPESPSDPIALGREVVRACEALGFAFAGVCEPTPTDRRAELLEWLAQGKQGEMTWMAEDVDLRADPSAMFPGAQSMILVADQYAESAPVPARAQADTAASPVPGRIARYAQGNDYHAAIRKRLHTLADELRRRHPAHEFRSFVDTAPVLEREHAARAALGWIGKHTLLIRPSRGSYLLLGGVLTSLHLRSDPARLPLTDHCGSCTRCIDACPTHAITPYSVDARACISYLTIEHRSFIDPSFHHGIGDWLFGCDICQDVCPFNAQTGSMTDGPIRIHPAYQSRNGAFDALAILDWTESDRERTLSGTSMKRVTLAMLKRNAIIVLGNHLALAADPSTLDRLRRLAASDAEPELVRDTARHVLRRLSGT